MERSFQHWSQFHGAWSSFTLTAFGENQMDYLTKFNVFFARKSLSCTPCSATDNRHKLIIPAGNQRLSIISPGLPGYFAGCAVFEDLVGQHANQHHGAHHRKVE